MLKIFDNIIYFLQKSGGGSVYWNEITKDYYGNYKIKDIGIL